MSAATTSASRPDDGMGYGPEQFAAEIRTDRAAAGEVVKAAGMTPQ